MLEKLKLLWRLMHIGEVVADPATWKNRQISINVLASIFATILALSKSFGYDFNISQEDIIAISGGVGAAVGIINGLLTVTTSAKVGLPPPASGVTQPTMQTTDALNTIN